MEFVYIHKNIYLVKTISNPKCQNYKLIDINDYFYQGFGKDFLTDHQKKKKKRLIYENSKFIICIL